MFDPVMDRQSPDKKLFVSAGSTKTVPLNKRRIFVAGASGPVTTVTLPNVSEAEGLKFVISATTVPATTGAQITVDYGDGNASSLTTTISTTGVLLELESDGREWFLTRG